MSCLHAWNCYNGTNVLCCFFVCVDNLCTLWLYVVLQLYCFLMNTTNFLDLENYTFFLFWGKLYLSPPFFSIHFDFYSLFCSLNNLLVFPCFRCSLHQPTATLWPRQIRIHHQHNKIQLLTHLQLYQEQVKCIFIYTLSFWINLHE